VKKRCWARWMWPGEIGERAPHLFEMKTEGKGGVRCRRLLRCSVLQVVDLVLERRQVRRLGPARDDHCAVRRQNNGRVAHDLRRVAKEPGVGKIVRVQCGGMGEERRGDESVLHESDRVFSRGSTSVLL
jgi:hypothetical protein